MTVFFVSENEVCRELMTSFEFFDDVNLESISAVLKELNLNYADDQIGFIIPSENNDFSEEVKEFLEKSSLQTDYFFAIIVQGKKSSDSARKFLDLCKKSNVNLRYLNCISGAESKRRIKDKGIGFRSDIGMQVSKIHGINLTNRFLGYLERVCSKIGRK